MEILQNLLLFFGQALIIVLSIIAVIIAIAASATKSGKTKGLDVEVINDKFDDQKTILQAVVLNDDQFKKAKKQKKVDLKTAQKDKNERKTAYLIEFLKGDIEASAVDNIKEEISAVLGVAEKNEEVILKVESPGGVVHGYGLAAAQILRLREAGLNVTICVDKVAASGGYLMSCVAHQIIASPFAIIGSIGVVAQVPNINRLLKKHDVDFKEYTAGDYKRTVSVLGEITEKGEAKFKEQLEATHVLFKDFVSLYRPQLNLTTVATGEYWYGTQALKLNLIDRIQTSDDYILNKVKTHKVIKVRFSKKAGFADKISEMISQTILQSVSKTLTRTGLLNK